MSTGNDDAVTEAPYLLAVTRPTCHRCGDQLEEPLATTCEHCRVETLREMLRFREYLREAVALERSRCNPEEPAT
jgi:predicted amidophosphoribosyltransferase